MSSRKVRPDELELWQRVAQTTDRLHPARKPQEKMADIFPSDNPSKKRPDDLPKFKVGQKANGHAPSLPGIASAAPKPSLHMDKKAYDRLKRGKLKPQGRIDLHGMTMDQAQPALIAFIMSSYAKDRRLVLVITGKGQGKDREDVGPIPERPGILRRNVPHWLQTPPMAQVVLQVTEAHGRHGGGGAYYVYLRRRR
ncbi:MAG: Smr/MutS family protein [Pseudomonadota bacterium]